VIDTKIAHAGEEHPGARALHNVYVTADNKFVVTGSIRTKTLTVIDSQVRADRLGAEARPGRAADDVRDESRRLDQAHFHPALEPERFLSGDFATRKETQRIVLPAEPTGFGVAERRGDSPSHASASRPTARRCG